MTPRTRLNTLLKEIGVDYWCVQGITFWNCDDGRECLAYEYETSEGELHLALKVVRITPEQAIVATVGEECEMRICKRCGVAYELNIIDKGYGKPRFCPNCGFRLE